MGIYQQAAWNMVIGIALMLVGGLTLWAYGARRKDEALVLSAKGPEAEATQRFHVRLARWFYLYGIGVALAGVLVLFRAATVLL